MNADALPSIDQLRQLPLPAPVSYWPQTWGWLVVLGLVLLLAGGLAGWSIRKRRRNRYRREGLRQLEQLRQAAQTDPLAARELPGLLKRVGLSSVSDTERARVAALGGADWLAYLSGNGGAFAPDAEPLLRALAYGSPDTVRAIPQVRLQALFAASRQWMERDHVAA